MDGRFKNLQCVLHEFSARNDRSGRTAGCSHEKENQCTLRHGCLGYVRKPYNIESLNQTIRSVLDSEL